MQSVNTKSQGDHVVTSFKRQGNVTPPGAVSLKPFIREYSQERNRSNIPSSNSQIATLQKGSNPSLVCQQRSYEEQHFAPESEYAPREGETSNSRSQFMQQSNSASGSQLRPGTSLFYEPSAQKADGESKVATVGQAAMGDRHGFYQAVPMSDTFTSPGPPQQQLSASLRSKNLPRAGVHAEEPSFARSFEQSFLQHHQSSGQQYADQDARNKRSVQVPNPENRVLFELTTISNEIGRDNMTTVQTTLIPNSNRSLKNQPDQITGMHKRGSSQEPLPFTTEELVQNQGRENGGFKRAGAPQRSHSHAYRDVVMNHARRQLGIDSGSAQKPHQNEAERNTNSYSDNKLVAGQNYINLKAVNEKKFATQTSSSCAPIPLSTAANPLARGSSSLTRGQNQVSQQDFNKYPHQQDYSRDDRHKAHSAINRDSQQNFTNMRPHSSRLQGRNQSHSPTGPQQPTDAQPEQKFLSTMGTNNLRSELNFDNVTSGQYQETEMPYSYSMYTETLQGQDRSDKKSKAVSRNNGRQERFNSISGSNCYIDSSREKENGQQITSGQVQLYQAAQLHSNGTQQESPEREVFTEGQQTAMFARNQLKGFSTAGADQNNQSSLGEMKPPIAKQPMAGRRHSKHVHSDSIMMSAQLQADSVHQMLSQENLLNDAQIVSGEQNPDKQTIFSEKDKRVDGIGKIGSLGSLDRKTFTLGGEKQHYYNNTAFSGQVGITSKTDLQSMNRHFITSPTDAGGQLITSATQKLPENLLHPISMQLNHDEKGNTQRQPHHTERHGISSGNVGFYPRSSRDVSSDLKEYLKFQQVTNQRQQTDQTLDKSMSPRGISSGKKISTTHVPVQVQSYQQMPQTNRTPSLVNSNTYDIVLSQPYQMSEQLNAVTNQERGEPSNLTTIQQIQQNNHNFLQEHHNMKLSDRRSTNKAMAGAISDPSLSLPSQLFGGGVPSQTSQWNLGSQQQLPPKVHPHMMSAQLQQQQTQQQQDDRATTLRSSNLPNQPSTTYSHPLLQQQHLFLANQSSYSPRANPAQTLQNQQNLPYPSLNSQRNMNMNMTQAEFQLNQQQMSMDGTLQQASTMPANPYQGAINSHSEISPLSHRNGAIPGGMLTLQHNLSQVTTGVASGGASSSVLKQEVLLLRKQLNDAKNSNLFLKKQALQLQHTINMQQIQMNQLEEAVGVKDSCQEDDQAKMNHLEARYEEQFKLSEELLKKQEESEELYNQRLQMCNDELEHVRGEKMRNEYHIHANVMQLSSAMAHLAETVGDQSYLAPFLAHFGKVCETLTALVGATTYTPGGMSERGAMSENGLDHKHQLKMMKRANNFEKFRKEIRALCKSHYRTKIHERDIELAKSLKHIKTQEKQLHKLAEVCESMRASYEQAQDNMKTMQDENRQLVHTFDDERLKLEKKQLDEVARLHKAVKQIQKSTRQNMTGTFGKRRRSETPNQTTIGQSTIEVEETLGTESDALTTIDGRYVPRKHILENPKVINFANDSHQTYKQSNNLLSTLPSQDPLPSSSSCRPDYVQAHDITGRNDDDADDYDEKQLILLQNEQFRQTLQGQNVLIQQLQRALIQNQQEASQQFQALTSQQESMISSELQQQHNQQFMRETQGSSVMRDDAAAAYYYQESQQRAPVLFYRADGSYSVSAEQMTLENLPPQPTFSHPRGRNSSEIEIFDKTIQVYHQVKDSLQESQQIQPESSFQDSQAGIQIINEQEELQSNADEKNTLSETDHVNVNTNGDIKLEKPSAQFNFRDLRPMSSAHDDLSIANQHFSTGMVQQQSTCSMTEQVASCNSSQPISQKRIGINTDASQVTQKTNYARHQGHI